MEGERALPHSIEAERAVLGGLMLDSVIASEVSEMLRNAVRRGEIWLKGIECILPILGTVGLWWHFSN